MRIFNQIFLVLFVSSFVLIYPQNKKPAVLYPVDHTIKDRSLVRFKKDIFKAINNKDTSFIISVLDTNILNSFGGSGGIKELREMWELGNANSSFWIELKEVFSMGGTFIGKDKKLFAIPYVFSEWPEDYDPFTYVAVVKKNINLRDSSSSKSKILKRLSYNIVELLENGVNDKWSRVMTADSVMGYIYSDFIRSPVDYRAILLKEKGKWKIISFVSGD